MSRQKRIEEYSKPASEVWWDGRSNKPAIERWQGRAKENSQLAPRAKSGSVELPTTGPVREHNSAARHADPRSEAKSDKNHVDKLTEYMRGVRRES
jgi:hypothetical protein